MNTNTEQKYKKLSEMYGDEVKFPAYDGDTDVWTPVFLTDDQAQELTAIEIFPV